MWELGDYLIALAATAVVIYLTGWCLIRAFFVARRRHFHSTMHDLTRGDIS